MIDLLEDTDLGQRIHGNQSKKPFFRWSKNHKTDLSFPYILV